MSDTQRTCIFERAQTLAWQSSGRPKAGTADMKSGIPAGIVAALRLTQITAMGTLYYSFSF